MFLVIFSSSARDSVDNPKHCCVRNVILLLRHCLVLWALQSLAFRLPSIQFSTSAAPPPCRRKLLGGCEIDSLHLSIELNGTWRSSRRLFANPCVSFCPRSFQTTIKIYTSCLRVDIEYKTLGIQWETTAGEVVRQVLRRCKMRHRDPRLFYLSMEVTIRKAGVKTLLKLEDDARPSLLQACHPKGDSR